MGLKSNCEGGVLRTEVTTAGAGAVTDTNLVEVGGVAVSLGQKVMAGSLSVVIASDQSPLPISISSADVNIDQYGGVATTLGQKTMAASMPVVLSSDQSALPISITSADVNLIEVGGAAIAIGQAAMAASLPVVIANNQSALPVTGTLFQATQPVSAAALPLPTGAATSALQTQPGVDIGDVTINNGAAAAAVNIQDGGNTITVDGTVAVSGTVTTTAVGTIADDSPTPGSPVMTGGFAKTPDGTDPGNVSAEDDVTRFITDLNRRQYVNNVHPRFGHKHLDGSAAYTDESIVADPGDGFQVIITNIIGSTGAATALNFFLEEGASKIFGPIYLEAVAGRGFCSGPIHLPVTASTAVTLTSSAAIAQSFDIDYFIQKV